MLCKQLKYSTFTDRCHQFSRGRIKNSIIMRTFALRPELLFSSWFHIALTLDLRLSVLSLGRVDASITLLSLTRTLGTGFHIPYPDVIAATVQAEATDLASIRWGYIGYDAANYDVLYRLAVRTDHWGNLLAEEATPLVHLGFIPTLFATIFQFPGHLTISFL